MQMFRLERQRVFPAPGGHPCGLAWDGEALWCSDGRAEAIYRLDRELRPQYAIRCPTVRTGLAWDGEALWQVAGRPAEVRRYRTTGELVDRRGLGPDGEFACGMDIRDGTVYVAWRVLGHVTAQGVDTGEVTGTWTVASEPGGLACAPGELFVADNAQGEIVRLDLTAGAALRARVGGSPTGLAWDGELLWVNDYATATISSYRVYGSQREGGGR